MREEVMGPSGSGITALESRIRVGCVVSVWPFTVELTRSNCRPLRPATCQSVRMVFLALIPGVHTIGAIKLTDIETQYVLTLRYSNTSLFD